MRTKAVDAMIDGARDLFMVMAESEAAGTESGGF